MIELTPEEIDEVIRALGECKLPSKNSSVSIATLIQTFKQARDAPHPFSQPRMQPWIKKSFT